MLVSFTWGRDVARDDGVLLRHYSIAVHRWFFGFVHRVDPDEEVGCSSS